MKIAIKVIPNAKKSEIVQLADGFKIKVNQPPEDNKANEAVIEILAKHFKVKKSAVTIITGLHSRNKIVEIS